jgi:hypothetical protein
VAWNQSRVKLFRRCQKAYAFRYHYADESELVTKLPSLPLKKGDWLHKLQQAHYRDLAGITGKRFPGVGEVMATMNEEFDKLFDEEKELYGELPQEVWRLFRTYLRHYERADPPDRYEVATLTNGTPAVEFVVEVPLTKYGIEDPFKGRIDLVVEDKEYGGLWIRDAKWVSKIPGPDERYLSPQALMYAWAMRKLGYDIRGFVYDYGCTKAPTWPSVLKRNSQYGSAGYLTTKPSLACDYWTYLEAIKAAHGEDWKFYAKTVYLEKLKELQARHALWFRRERLPVEGPRIKRALAEYITSVRDIEGMELTHTPRTYDWRCKFSCEYHDICVGEFNGLDIEPMIKAKFTVQEERYGEDSEPEL